MLRIPNISEITDYLQNRKMAKYSEGLVLNFLWMQEHQKL